MCIMIIQRAFENPIQTLLLILISVLIFFTLQGWNKYLRTRLLPAPRSSGPGPDPNNRAAVCWKIHTFFIFQKTHVNGQGSYLYQDICCLGVENTGIGCFRFSLNVYLILNMIMIIINFPHAHGNLWIFRIKSVLNQCSLVTSIFEWWGKFWDENEA